MQSAGFISIPMVRRVVFALICAFPAVASAQAWVGPYRAGDYEKAVELLQEAVSKAAGNPAFDQPEPLQLLATLYAQGQGVAANPLMACSLARLAWAATQMQVVPGEDGKRYQARMDASEAFVHRHCDSLAHDDRMTAESAIGCFAFGMQEQTIAFGDQIVRIGRRGVSIADRDEPPWELMGCPSLVARVRTTSLAPPPDAAPGVKARHFIETFMWVGGMKDGVPFYSLNWDVYEVRDKRILFFMVAQGLVTRSAWPGRGLPAEIEKGLTLEMIRSGPVRWTIDGSPPKRGWIMLDGQATR